MKKRPLSITILGWIFISIGAGVLVANAFWLVQGMGDASGMSAHEKHDLLWVVVTQLWAIVAGVFMLRGANWARWLLVAWLAFHLLLGAHHDFHATVVHGVLLAVGVYFLFRGPANEFFRGEGGVGA